MGSMGFGAIGSLCIGKPADIAGDRTAACVCAAGTGVAALFLMRAAARFMPEIETTLRQNGLLPESESGGSGT